jgi:hypothetical protein
LTIAGLLPVGAGAAVIARAHPVGSRSAEAVAVVAAPASCAGAPVVAVFSRRGLIRLPLRRRALRAALAATRAIALIVVVIAIVVIVRSVGAIPRRGRERRTHAATPR